MCFWYEWSCFLQLGAHERAALARLHVLELDDLERGPSSSQGMPFFRSLVEIAHGISASGG